MAKEGFFTITLIIIFINTHKVNKYERYQKKDV